MKDKPKNPFVYPQEERMVVGEVEHVKILEGGMTLRDYFAGQALMGMKAMGTIYDSRAELAKWSYEIADAMLAARESTTEGTEGTEGTDEQD